jgi:hypothetical protein
MARMFKLFAVPESISDANWDAVTSGPASRLVKASSEREASELLHRQTLRAVQLRPGFERRAPWLSPDMSVCVDMGEA